MDGKNYEQREFLSALKRSCYQALRKEQEEIKSKPMKLNKILHYISDTIMYIFLQQLINIQTSRNFLLLLNHKDYH